MKIVIAMDSFKGSMTSVEAGEAAKRGILLACPNAAVEVIPMADGGEGTLEAFITGKDSRLVELVATGPDGEERKTQYYICNENTAVIEMATIAGLELVEADRRNPMRMTTFGVGELICDAIDRGIRRFLIGIGGSATNDGGIGMLEALGYRFLDDKGREVDRYATALGHVSSIDDSQRKKELSECSFVVACDVKNPLCGENGCSMVFGPQKGATLDMIKSMDAWMESYAGICKEKYPDSDSNYPGAGAAGGMGFAFMTFLNGTLKSGADIIIEENGLKKHISDADYVFTGEGRVDEQTLMGKAPAVVASIAKKHNVPVILLAGTFEGNLEKIQDIGPCFSIVNRPMTKEDAMDGSISINNMETTSKQIMELILLSEKRVQ